MNEENKSNLDMDSIILEFMMDHHKYQNKIKINYDNKIYNDVSRIIEFAIQRITTQLIELNIPIIEGVFDGTGSAVIRVSEIDIFKNKAYFTQGSIAVIDVTTDYVSENDEDDALEIKTSFEVHIRFGESNTWLSIGAKTPKKKDEDEDEDEYYDEIDCEDDRGIREVVTKEEKQRMAVIAATSHGFRELKNRQQRMAFVAPIIDAESSGKEWDSYLRPEHDIADMATELYELGIIPKRAKSYADKGKTAAEVGKLLGISKQKAERAISAEIPKYIEDQLTGLSEDD